MIEIVRGNIAALDVDAIVNAANAGLNGGGGVDGAIHRAAGPALREELRHFGGCPTGGAVRTRGHRLPARFVIHAVGPIWRGGGEDEAALLASAYEESFARAREEPSIRTIAFSAISTGVYGYPREAAARIAARSLRAHESEFERIVACIWDDETERIYRDELENPE